jgi:polysaccharide biosynthesis protein PslG
MTRASTSGARPAGHIAALAIVLLALLAALALPGRADAAQAPKGFFGVHPLIPQAGDYGTMADADVGMIRTGFAYRQWKAGPAAFDAIVRGAAEQRIDLLPVVVGTESSARGATPLDSPAAKEHWKDYLTALVERYGPGGNFWSSPASAGVPTWPITDWQVWNEPNSFNNWAKPDPQQYGKLLALSAKTIHAADRKATVVSAGVISDPVNRRAEAGASFLRKMLKSKKAAKAADVIAVHPYTAKVKNVEKNIEQARKVLNKAKLKRTPLWVTEIGWGSGSGSSPLVVPAAKQKRNLRDSFRMMLKERRKLKLGKVIWYQWRDGPDTACNWCGTSGLLTDSGTRKPLFDEFAAIAR